MSDRMQKRLEMLLDISVKGMGQLGSAQKALAAFGVSAAATDRQLAAMVHNIDKDLGSLAAMEGKLRSIESIKRTISKPERVASFPTVELNKLKTTLGELEKEYVKLGGSLRSVKFDVVKNSDLVNLGKVSKGLREVRSAMTEVINSTILYEKRIGELSTKEKTLAKEAGITAKARIISPEKIRVTPPAAREAARARRLAEQDMLAKEEARIDREYRKAVKVPRVKAPITKVGVEDITQVKASTEEYKKLQMAAEKLASAKDKVATKAKKLKTEVSEETKALSTESLTVTQKDRLLSILDKSTSKMVTAVGNLGRGMKDEGKQMGQLVSSFGQAVTQMERGSKSINKAGTSLSQTAKAAKATQTAFGGLAKGSRAVISSIKDTDRATTTSTSALKQKQTALDKTSKAVKSTGQTIKATGDHFKHFSTTAGRTREEMGFFYHRLEQFRGSTAKLTRFFGALRNQLLLLAFTFGGMMAMMGKFFESSRLAEAAIKGLGAVAVNTGANLKVAEMAALGFSEKGLMSIRESASALKNLLSAGYGLPESINLMNALTNAAAFNRQGQLSLGEAVIGATEGIKNENCKTRKSLIFNTLTRTYETIGDIFDNWNSPFYTISYNEENKELEYNLVTSAICNGERDGFKVTLESGKDIELTAEDRVYTKRGWVEVQDLVVNEDEILAVDNHTEIVDFYNKELELTYEEKGDEYFIDCLNCGELIKVQKAKLGRKKFCSQECCNDYKTKEGSGRGENNKTCLYCKTEFHTKPSKMERKKFCSFDCKKKWYIENPSIGPESNVICSVCSKSFYKKPFRLNKDENHFCSRECKGEWISSNAIGENGYNFKYGKNKLVRYNCDLCGIEFDIEQHKLVNKVGDRHLCSDECLSMFRQGLALSNPKVRRAWNYINNRCDNLGIKSTDYLKWKKDVLIRDNKVCRLCGSKDYLCTHHGVSVRERPDLALDINNGITVCVKCHNKIHQIKRIFKEKWEKVISVISIGAEPVYDLTVEKVHNFMANQMIVHNCIAWDTRIYDPVRREWDTIEGWHDRGIVPCVLSVNRQTGLMEVAQAEYLHYNGIKEVFEVELEDGKTEEVTINHRFLTPKGFVFTGDLVENQDLLYIVNEETLNINNNEELCNNVKFVEKNLNSSEISTEVGIDIPSAVVNVLQLLQQESLSKDGELLKDSLNLTAESAEEILLRLQNWSKEDTELYVQLLAGQSIMDETTLAKIALDMLIRSKDPVKFVEKKWLLSLLEKKLQGFVQENAEQIGGLKQQEEKIIQLGRVEEVIKNQGDNEENIKSGNGKYFSAMSYDVLNAVSLAQVIITRIIFSLKKNTQIFGSKSIMVSPFVHGVTEKTITLLNEHLKKSLVCLPILKKVVKITYKGKLKVYELSVPHNFNFVANSIIQNNSIMIDNAGVTKNLSIMYKEFAASIGTTVGALTELQKRQAKYEGILRESLVFTGNIDKYMNTASGAIMQFNANLLQMQVTLGNMLGPAVSTFMSAIGDIVGSIKVWGDENQKLGASLKSFARDIGIFTKDVAGLFGFIGGSVIKIAYNFSTTIMWVIKLWIAMKMGGMIGGIFRGIGVSISSIAPHIHNVTQSLTVMNRVAQLDNFKRLPGLIATNLRGFKEFAVRQGMLDVMSLRAARSLDKMSLSQYTARLNAVAHGVVLRSVTAEQYKQIQSSGQLSGVIGAVRKNLLTLTTQTQANTIAMKAANTVSGFFGRTINSVKTSVKGLGEWLVNIPVRFKAWTASMRAATGATNNWALAVVGLKTAFVALFKVLWPMLIAVAAFKVIDWFAGAKQRAADLNELNKRLDSSSKQLQDVSEKVRVYKNRLDDVKTSTQLYSKYLRSDYIEVLKTANDSYSKMIKTQGELAVAQIRAVSDPTEENVKSVEESLSRFQEFESAYGEAMSKMSQITDEHLARRQVFVDTAEEMVKELSSGSELLKIWEMQSKSVERIQKLKKATLSDIAIEETIIKQRYGAVTYGQLLIRISEEAHQRAVAKIIRKGNQRILAIERETADIRLRGYDESLVIRLISTYTKAQSELEGIANQIKNLRDVLHANITDQTLKLSQLEMKFKELGESGPKALNNLSRSLEQFNSGMDQMSSKSTKVLDTMERHKRLTMEMNAAWKIFNETGVFGISAIREEYYSRQYYNLKRQISLLEESLKTDTDFQLQVWQVINRESSLAAKSFKEASDIFGQYFMQLSSGIALTSDQEVALAALNKRLTDVFATIRIQLEAKGEGLAVKVLDQWIVKYGEVSNAISKTSEAKKAEAMSEQERALILATSILIEHLKRRELAAVIEKERELRRALAREIEQLVYQEGKAVRELTNSNLSLAESIQELQGYSAPYLTSIRNTVRAYQLQREEMDRVKVTAEALLKGQRQEVAERISKKTKVPIERVSKVSIEADPNIQNLVKGLDLIIERMALIDATPLLQLSKQMAEIGNAARQSIKSMQMEGLGVGEITLSRIFLGKNYEAEGQKITMVFAEQKAKLAEIAIVAKQVAEMQYIANLKNAKSNYEIMGAMAKYKVDLVEIDRQCQSEMTTITEEESMKRRQLAVDEAAAWLSSIEQMVGGFQEFGNTMYEVTIGISKTQSDMVNEQKKALAQGEITQAQFAENMKRIDAKTAADRRKVWAGMAADIIRSITRSVGAALIEEGVRQAIGSSGRAYESAQMALWAGSMAAASALMPPPVGQLYAAQFAAAATAYGAIAGAHGAMAGVNWGMVAAGVGIQAAGGFGATALERGTPGGEFTAVTAAEAEGRIEGERTTGGTIRAENLDITISPVVYISGNQVFIGSGSVAEFTEQVQDLLVSTIQSAVDRGELDLSEIARKAVGRGG